MQLDMQLDMQHDIESAPTRPKDVASLVEPSVTRGHVLDDCCRTTPGSNKKTKNPLLRHFATHMSKTAPSTGFDLGKKTQKIVAN